MADGTSILDGVGDARLHHGWLAMVLPLLLHPCVAQEMRELTTGDGTRFVLVRTGSLPLVYWTMATPAGVFADPVRAPGLSHAVFRSTLLGSVRMGTRDTTAEARSLAELDALEVEVARARQRGAVDQEKLESLHLARAAARALADPGALARVLRDMQCREPQLEERQGAALLTIAGIPGALPALARRIRELRDEPVLRSVQEIYENVYREKAAARSGGARATLENELLDLGFPGHPFRRLAEVDSVPEPVSREEALALFRQNVSGSRAVHVLTGGLDLDLTTTWLEETFAGPAAKAGLGITPFVVSPRPRGARGSRLQGDMSAVLIGVRLDALGRPLTATDIADLAVLGEWLCGGETSLLARSLRRRGLTDVVLRAELPFPSGMPPYFGLLEVSGGTNLDVDRLAGSFTEALDMALESKPLDEDLTAAMARIRVRTLREQLGPRELGVQLAVRIAGLGLAPSAAYAPSDLPDSNRLLTLARAVLAVENRSTVRQAGHP